jgi:hypothetical protein
LVCRQCRRTAETFANKLAGQARRAIRRAPIPRRSTAPKPSPPYRLPGRRGRRTGPTRYAACSSHVKPRLGFGYAFTETAKLHVTLRDAGRRRSFRNPLRLSGFLPTGDVRPIDGLHVEPLAALRDDRSKRCATLQALVIPPRIGLSAAQRGSITVA